MTVIKDENIFKRLMFMTAIPKEMFWAYMAVQQSGIWNMMCVDPVVGRYHHSDTKEMIDAMDQAYMKFVVYTNADITQDEYVHVTKDHVRLIQHLYSDLYKAYGKDYPKNVVKIKLERSIKISV